MYHKTFRTVFGTGGQCDHIVFDTDFDACIIQGSSLHRFQKSAIDVIRRIADRGENIQVWIEPVVFNDLLKWLNALDEKYALRVTQIDVSAAEKPGMVNVQRLEFGRG